VSPRVDLQYSPNITLTFRYGITQADIQDAGIGSFDLASRGYHTQYTNQTAQVSATAALGQTLNESRFQYYRNHFQTSANSTTPALLVLGSFNGGGASSSHTLDAQDNFEFQNYTSRVRGTHGWKFGVRLRGQMDDNLSPQNFNGTFTFGGGYLGPMLDANNRPVSGTSVALDSIERYRRTLLFQQLGYSASQIRALGGGATQFSISTGQPELSVHQVDFAIFAGDEWRVRPNLTLSYGLRYEGQSNVHDWRDWAPRVSIAWAVGSKRKTVLRAGFGMFYDRFALGNTLTAARYNGVVQQQYIVANPDFFPAIPSVSELGAAQSQSIEKISSGLRAPYLMQTAVTVERQLAAGTTLAVTYTNAHGLRALRSEDINALLPGSFNSSVPGSGVFPLGHPGPVFEMESSGRYNQNQLVANVKTRLNAGTSLFAFYVLGKAMSNTDGVNTFAANPYDSRGEYGPAATDVRHRITAGGTASLRWGVRFSPYVIVQSGAPFDITSGNDAYGTTLFNSRPGFATDPSKPGLISTRYGLLDPNPDLSEKLLGRNYGRGPALISMNLRIGKAVGFGPIKEEHAEKSAPNGGGSVPIEAVGNRGLSSILGRPATAHRYNLSFSISARNLLNHKNQGPIIGDITSPLFGASNQIAGTPNGEGFYETANNRRLELQVRLSF
jgi:TonB dependent receptor